MECSCEILLNLLGLEATIFPIFGTKTRDFKTTAAALTQEENILLANVFEIEKPLAKSSCLKPSLIFIKHNKNSSLAESFDFGPIFLGEFLKRLTMLLFTLELLHFLFRKGLKYSKNLSNNALDLIPA